MIVLLSYKGKPMAVPLGPDVNAQGVTTTGGFNWTPSIFLYQSGDCSGRAYAFGNVSFGTRYVGWTGVVNGKNYIHVVDIRNSATTTYNSVFDGIAGACFSVQGEAWLTPVITSVPTAPLATPPFLVK